MLHAGGWRSAALMVHGVLQQPFLRERAAFTCTDPVVARSQSDIQHCSPLQHTTEGAAVQDHRVTILPLTDDNVCRPGVPCPPSVRMPPLFAYSTGLNEFYMRK